SRIPDGLRRWPVGVASASAVASFALDSRPHAGKIGAVPDARGMTVKTAVDRIGVLRLAERIGRRRRRLGVMSDREPRTALPRVPGDAMLEVSAFDPADGRDSLSPGAKSPLERRSGLLAAAPRKNGNSAGRWSIFEFQSAFLANRVADEFFR